MQRFRIFFLFLISITLINCSHDKKLADEIEHSLKTQVLAKWYPAAIDSVHGGYLCNFTFDWQPKPPHAKMLVNQARHVWTTSTFAKQFNDPEFQQMAKHGVDYLQNVMWDKEYGGFYMMLAQDGSLPKRHYEDYAKSAYSNAFAMYGLSSYYALTHDSSALDLAQKTFHWLEKNAHDPVYGGYFDQLNRDGSPFSEFNWKDQNSSIHLLEAFTALYHVWPDSLVRVRLQEMLSIIRDTIVKEPGTLTQFSQPDWTPVSLADSSRTYRDKKHYYDHVSFGHDIETAYLLLEASHGLGLEHDTKTLAVSKKLVDHTLEHGWDNENGGFYDAGYYFKNEDTLTVVRDEKIWWVEAEGLNSLLLMSKLFPHEKIYRERFEQQWEYIKTYMIDHENGGWYRAGYDIHPQLLKARKGYNWKTNYHNSRALMNCVKILRGESELVMAFR